MCRSVLPFYTTHCSLIRFWSRRSSTSARPQSLDAVVILLRNLAVTVIFATTMIGCVRGYEMEFRNNLLVSLNIETRQFHATDFGSMRDRKFPDKNLVQSKNFLVTSGTKVLRKYNDATGGFWVLWSAISLEDSEVICTGEVDLTRGHSPFVVDIDKESCPSR